MKQTQAQVPMTFKVQIEECRNFTWMGKLTVGEQTVRFRSGIELLLTIDEFLHDRKDCK